MAYDFNAQEIFEIAVRIEANGAAFYRRAASLMTDESDKKFLETLARMEDRHQASFEHMKAQLSDLEETPTVFDPNDEQILYLNAMADSHGGEGSPGAADALTGKENIEKIILTAMDLERESILFYLGLIDFVPPKLGREKIQQIIDEEKKHVAQLRGYLTKVQKESG